MMDMNKFIKKEMGKALEALPPEQRVDMNRFINKLGGVMGNESASMDEKIKEVKEIEKEMQTKYGVNSNR